MRNVTAKSQINGQDGRVASMNISYAGRVLPLLTFNTKYSRYGRVQTQVKRNGGASSLERAFVASIYGPAAVFDTGDLRSPN